MDAAVFSSEQARRACGPSSMTLRAAKEADVICIFNPEHDLCLANGDENYIPPASAMQFGKDCKDMMKVVYGEGVCCFSTQELRQCPSAARIIIPWGWNAVLRRQLVRANFPESLLPSLPQLDSISRLQHRTTAMQCLVWLSRQTGSSYPVYSIDGKHRETSSVLDDLLDKHGRLLLKAPWSGSGRGLRWLNGKVGGKDGEWILRVARQQGGVMVEPWLDVLQDFAMEFWVGEEIRFIGYSLFSSKAGVYQGNELLSDHAVEQRLNELVPAAQLRHIRLLLTHWLLQNVQPLYRGPLGVDMFVYASDRGPRIRPCSEINFRHTMGLVAHEYYLSHPEEEGRSFSVIHEKINSESCEKSSSDGRETNRSESRYRIMTA